MKCVIHGARHIWSVLSEGNVASAARGHCSLVGPHSCGLSGDASSDAGLIRCLSSVLLVLSDEAVVSGGAVTEKNGSSAARCLSTILNTSHNWS